ncbi:MAG: hypothetical protein K8S97_08500 [Anaerolineae bacterium]|nr:hypothetical protein [Anaerolineae bacterium]
MVDIKRRLAQLEQHTPKRSYDVFWLADHPARDLIPLWDDSPVGVMPQTDLAQMDHLLGLGMAKCNFVGFSDGQLSALMLVIDRLNLVFNGVIGTTWRRLQAIVQTMTDESAQQIAAWIVETFPTLTTEQVITLGLTADEKQLGTMAEWQNVLING